MLECINKTDERPVEIVPTYTPINVDVPIYKNRE